MNNNNNNNNNLIYIEAGEFVDEQQREFSTYTTIQRGLPQLEDGLLPVQRKILYGMHKSKFNSKNKFHKSNELVASAMRYYTHGDTGLYLAISKLTSGYEGLLYPLVISHGIFGKAYSTAPPSAMRYTSGKLSSFTEDVMLSELSKNCVEFILDEEDSLSQPVTLPSVIPYILLRSGLALATGFNSIFPSYNLKDLVEATKKLIDNPTEDVLNILVPDFTTKGKLIRNKSELRKIYNTGKGSIVLQSRYEFDPKQNAIIITEIPYSPTINKESLIQELVDKMDKYKDIIDIKDASEYDAVSDEAKLGIMIKVKKGTNVDLLMRRLFKSTKLQSSFGVNQTLLVDFQPKTLGTKDIILKWVEQRVKTLKKGIEYDLNQKNKRMHVLEGLRKILLDIDKAIKVIRNTDNEVEEALIKEFGIDKEQAEFISKIQLKNINKKYILKQLEDIDKLKEEISGIEELLSSDEKVKKLIKEQMDEVVKKYNRPRLTEIIDYDVTDDLEEKHEIEEYNCKVMVTKQGYIKKTIKGGNHNIKDGDSVVEEFSCKNSDIIYIFTKEGARYRVKVWELNLKKPSDIGEYIIKDGEVTYVFIVDESKGKFISVYSNGKVACSPIESYAKKNNKIVNCKNGEQDLVDMYYIQEDMNLGLINKNGRLLIIGTELLSMQKATNSQGVVGINIDDEIGEEVVGSFLFDEAVNLTINTTKGKEYHLGLGAKAMSKYKKGRGSKGSFVKDRCEVVDFKIEKDE